MESVQGTDIQERQLDQLAYRIDFLKPLEIRFLRDADLRQLRKRVVPKPSDANDLYEAYAVVNGGN
jgi:hypothetical protein